MTTLSKAEQYVVERMNGTLPDTDTAITEGCRVYTSTVRTHISYRNTLNASKQGSTYRRDMLYRCFDWLKLLEKNNIKLVNG